MNRELGIAASLLAPILLGSVFALGRFALEGGDVPAASTYAEARQAMEAAGFDAGRGDVLAILPAWSLRPLEELKDFPWITGDNLGERPLDRWRRLYVLVENDGEVELERLRERRGAGETLFTSGPLRLLRFDLEAPRVMADLGRSLAQAEVRILDARGEEAVACTTRRRDGKGCPGRKGWQRVSREHLLVTENGDEAVWAHPPPLPEKLEVAWPEVELGSSLVLRAGFTRTGADKARAPVHVDVMLDGERLERVSFEPAFDFRSVRLDTDKDKGKRARVSFVISSRDNANSHFAFDAFTSSVPLVGEGDKG